MADVEELEGLGTEEVDPVEGLSEEERAALNDAPDEEEVEGLKALADEPEETTEDEEGDEEKDEAASSEEEETGEDGAGEDAGEEGDDGKDDTPPLAAEQQSAFLPTFEVNMERHKEIVEEMEQIQSRREELRAKREEGELDDTEYDKQFEQLLDRRAELVAEKTRIEEQAQANEQWAEQLWRHDQQLFFEREENRRFVDNAVLRGALDAAVREIASQEENANKSGLWILDEARRQVLAAMGVNEAPRDEKKAKPAEKKEPPRPKTGPKTLADMPADEGNEAGDDEFAELDRLDGIELEMAITRLSPEQQLRYARVGEGGRRSVR